MDPTNDQNKFFHNLIKKREMVNELYGCYVGNMERLVRLLVEQEVLTEKDQWEINHNKKWLYKKKLLVDILAGKNFDLIKRVMFAVRIVNTEENGKFWEFLEDLKNMVQKKFPFDSNLLKEPLQPDNMDYVVEPERESSGSASASIRLRTILKNFGVEQLENHLESIDSLDALVDLDSETETTSLHVCLLRSNKVLRCLSMILQKFQELYDNTDGWNEPTWTMQKFLDHQNIKQQTVAHLAAENSLIAVLQLLYKRRCGLFLKDQHGNTVIRLMYLHAPQAVPMVLDDAITGTQNHPNSREFKVEFNFCHVTGFLPDDNYRAPESEPKVVYTNGEHVELESLHAFNTHYETAKADEVHSTHRETELLVELDKAAANIILQHIIVKLFLEFKWDEMKIWLWVSTGVQILLNLLFYYFAILVFLIECRYGVGRTDFMNTTNTTITDASITSYGTTPETESDRLESVSSYVFGNWKPLSEVLLVNSERAQCYKPGSTFCYFLAIVLFGVNGIGFFVKEVIEVCLTCNKSTRCIKKKISSVDLRSNCLEGTFTFLSPYLKGVRKYLSAENILQLSCSIFTMMVTWPWITGRSTLTDSHYSLASVNVIISSSLILLQLCNYSSMGIHVQMLGKVIKRFGQIMAVYAWIIIAFAIAFSMQFPEEKPFRTLPEAIGRVIFMFVGEFGYNETIYSEQKGGPMIPPTGAPTFGSSAIFLHIVMLNLLVGLVIFDTYKLYEKSELVQLTTMIHTISMMEDVSSCFRWCFQLCRKGSNNKAWKMATYKRIDEVPERYRQQLIKLAMKHSED